MSIRILIFTALLLPGVFGAAWAQEGGTLERIQARSPSLIGNLQGNPIEPDVVVYLPPGYATDSARRYPVVYQLHGWLPTAEQWAGMISLKEGADRAMTAGEVGEMIVVLPNAYSIFGGAMYSSSVTSGDFEGFVARDVIDYIDSHYRTIPERASRGLSGHSMGGYGTMRIGMKYPDRYAGIYAMSSCCLAPFAADDPTIAQAAEIQSVEAGQSAPIFVRVQLTQAAAWSPNPDRPPLYLDLPMENGAERPDILSKWNANVPLAMVDQYVGNLKRYYAIGLEVGLQDNLLESNRELSRVLASYGIDHSFETYEGDHTNRVAERFETRVLPFFSDLLLFDR